MTPARSRIVSRRTALGAAASAAVGTGAVLAGASTPAQAHNQDGTDLRVSGSLTVVDPNGSQRFLADTQKPPVIIGGQTYAAELREGPADATYLIFNDSEGNERGGIVADTSGGQVSLDYPNQQAITLFAGAVGQEGAATLTMVEAPDPTLPIEQVTSSIHRVQLGWTTPSGAILELSDSQGRARILLQVDADDVARIQILDATGQVVSQLP